MRKLTVSELYLYNWPIRSKTEIIALNYYISSDKKLWMCMGWIHGTQLCVAIRKISRYSFLVTFLQLSISTLQPSGNGVCHFSLFVRKTWMIFLSWKMKIRVKGSSADHLWTTTLIACICTCFLYLIIKTLRRMIWEKCIACHWPVSITVDGRYRRQGTFWKKYLLICSICQMVFSV